MESIVAESIRRRAELHATVEKAMNLLDDYWDDLKFWDGQKLDVRAEWRLVHGARGEEIVELVLDDNEFGQQITRRMPAPELNDVRTRQLHMLEIWHQLLSAFGQRSIERTQAKVAALDGD